MSQRKRVIASILLFLVVFGALLAVATVYDLQIDHILTKNTIGKDHTNIFTNDVFGTTFEIVGTLPQFFAISFAMHILFWYGVYNFDKIKMYLTAIVTTVISVALYNVAFSGVGGYMKDHVALEAGVEELNLGGYLNPSFILLAIFATVMGTFAFKSIKPETIKKLFGFAFAMIAVMALSTVIIEAVKNPAGRVRYRVMNLRPDDAKYGFAAFAKWYEFGKMPMTREEKLAIYKTTEALKSFPSGHTGGAGVSYCAIMLISALDITDKKKKAILWIAPILWTGTVAVSRLVVGAHFFSDVLVGGTISFLSMILAREIFVLKGANIKALFCKN